jgi:hypothetical protein
MEKSLDDIGIQAGIWKKQTCGRFPENRNV